MKLAGNDIVFEDSVSLEVFSNQLSLQGELKLSQDLLDNNGMVLIKAGVPLRSSTFEKLREIKGSYAEVFHVRITPELTRIFSGYLAGHALQLIEDWGFLIRLYDIEGHRFRSYIRNAFRDHRIAVTCFLQMQRNPVRYAAMVTQGLLTLGIIMHGFFRIPRVHINAFLAGLLWELGDPDGALSREAARDAAALLRLKRSSDSLAEGLGAPKAVLNAIEAQEPFSELASEFPKSTVESVEVPALEAFLEQEGQEEEDAKGSDSDAGGAQIAEALSFSRYVLFLRDRLGKDEHAFEEISYRSAYSAKKGYFALSIVKPVLRVFKEYELEIRCMMKVAELEQKCIFGDSAWAYPKPRATQMICVHSKLECPLLTAGWDLTVVSPAEAYGWIGTSLDAGRYMKCQLGDELEDIFLRDMP